MKPLRKYPRRQQLKICLPISLYLLIWFGSGVLASARGQVASLDPDGTPHAAKLEPQAWKDPSAPMKIELVGDSTVQASSGWGDGFASMLTAGTECINLAKGGRSTRTFREEGRWTQALSLRPDVMVLGFGHNDLQNKSDRYVPIEDFRANLRRFVEEAHSAGVFVVLNTPIAYRRWMDDGKVLQPVNPTVAAYDQVTRDVAKEEGVPLLDLAVLTSSFYLRIGKETMDGYSLVTHGKTDPAHLNHEGGMAIGVLVAESARAMVPKLAPFLRPAN